MIQILKMCSEVLGEGVTKNVEYVFFAIRIATPILLIVLISKDMVSAVASQKEDDIKKAVSNAIKRIIAGIIIFFIPTIITLIINLIGKDYGCGM